MKADTAFIIFTVILLADRCLQAGSAAAGPLSDLTEVVGESLLEPVEGDANLKQTPAGGDAVVGESLLKPVEEDANVEETPVGEINEACLPGEENMAPLFSDAWYSGALPAEDGHDLANAMAELKAAYAVMYAAEGKILKVRAMRMLKAALLEVDRLVAAGGKLSEEDSKIISPLLDESAAVAEKYGVDPEKAMPNEQFQLAIEVIREKQKVQTLAMRDHMDSGDLEELTVAIRKAKQAGLTNVDLVEANAALDALIDQREAEMKLLDKPKSLAVASQLSGWVLFAICGIVYVEIS